MNEASRIRNAIEEGDSAFAEKLLPLVYEEQGKLASLRLIQEDPRQTLTATALVREGDSRLKNNV